MSDLLPPDADSRNIETFVHRYGKILIALVVILAVWGIASRVVGRMNLARQTEQAAVPVVLTTHAKDGDVAETLPLPGRLEAFYTAPIYARTSGYLKTWRTDIGTPVKKGDVLAEIDAPEIDQQYAQAQADMATAAANFQLANSTNQRWQGLVATESVSKQDADQKASDAAAKKAALQSATANLARLRELESFKRVVAPFDGVVTMRNTDIGALINAGQSAGNALFTVADTHRLRVYVAVPEAYALAVKIGMTAELALTERPGKAYAATVTSTAQALDATSRTLQVELQLDNTTGELLPGAYATVHFKLAPTTGTLRIPVNALVFRADGMTVATVDKTHHIVLKPITPGRDFGKEIEVRSGLNAEDEFVVNPPDSLLDGMEVRVMPPTPHAAGKEHP